MMRNVMKSLAMSVIIFRRPKKTMRTNTSSKRRMTRLMCKSARVMMMTMTMHLRMPFKLKKCLREATSSLAIRT